MEKAKGRKQGRAIIERISKRLLYSADVLFSDLAFAPGEDKQHQLGFDDFFETLISLNDTQHGKELVLINSDVADVELIIEQIDNSSRNIDYLLVDVETEGLDHVSQVLTSYTNIDAVHIIGHGQPGSFQLGSDSINQQMLSSNTAEFLNWQESLAGDAAVYLYGCNVASEGGDFVDSLADVLDRTVYASENVTGFSELNGDWVLEYGQNPIAQKSLFDENFAEVYASVLAPNTAPTFDVPDGQLLVNTSGGIDIINDGLVQADGKILVAGYANDSNWDFLLSRYNSDGTTDDSFGVNGVVRLDLGSAREQGFAVTQQPDGKIILVGSKEGLNSDGNSYSEDYVVARLNTDGSLDSSFGNSGYFQINFADEDDYARDVIVQPDGSIVVVGEVGRDIGVIKLSSSGQLDTSFGTAGKLTIDVSGNTDVAKAVTRLADGSLVLVGHSIDTSYDFLMINLSQDGSAGPNFHIIREDLGSNSVDAFYSVIQQSDGKIVVAGSSTLSGYYNSTIVRANLDGSFDTSFGNNGIANDPALFSSDYAQDIEVLDDGSYISSGWIGNDFSVVKYTSTGALDTSFANGGIYKSPIGGYSTGEAVEVLPDGSVIVIGHHSESSDSNTLIFKLDANGVLDESFAPSSTINAEPTYTEGAAPIVLDSSIDVLDAELDALNSGLGNYAGASLIVERDGGAIAEDLLDVAAASLIKNSQAIATVDSSTAGRLLITFTDANGEIPTSQDVDSILSQISYANSSDRPPASVNLTWTFNDGNSGAQGSGGAASVIEQSTVAITAVDDLPQNTGVALADVTAMLNQDLALDLSGLELSDADYADELVRVVLTATNGDFTGLADAAVTIQTFANGFIVNGSLDDVNAYLDTPGNVSYNSDTVGSHQVTIDFIVGSVTASAVDSFAVEVIENTAPSISAPTNLVVDEDSSLNSLTGISISDDAANGNVQLELETSGGTLNLDLSALTVVAGGNGTSNITVTGSLPDVNASLQGLQYTPATNVSGLAADNISITVNDLGSNGGPALTANEQFSIDISAVNDAPTSSGSYSNTLAVIEGQSSNIDFTGLSFDDVDGGDLTLVLRPSSGGSLNFNNTDDVSISHDSGTGTYLLTASIDNLNTFLSAIDSVQYSHADLSLSGTNVDRISVQISDQDLSGNNSAITVVMQEIDVSIQAVNNAPTISLPDSYTVNEDATLTVTGIQIADSDAGSEDVSVSIEVHRGSLALLQTNGVISSGELINEQDGSTRYRLTIVGSVDDINNVIDSLQYTPDSDLYGSGIDSIKVEVDDLGNTGGPALIVSKVATLNILPTPDPAVNTGTIPAQITVTEDIASAVDLSSLEFFDPDWDVSTSQYTLTLSTSAGGNLSLSSSLPLNIQNNGSSSVTVTGSLADLNQLLDDASALEYLHSIEHRNGSAADSLSISLQQNSSDNLAAQQIANIDININAQNDAPTITLPSQLTAIAGQSQIFAGFSVADVDADSSDVSVKMGVDTGSLSLSQTSGLSIIAVVFSNADGETVTGFELRGSIADINQALNSLSYNAASNNIGTAVDKLSIVINDEGNSGGAALEASSTLAIDISPQASDPSNSGTLPSSLAVVEDTFSPLDLSSVVLVDADGSASTYQLTLSTNNGQLQVSGTAGLLVNNVGTGTVQLSGSLSDLNDWLSSASGLQYQHDTEHRFGDAADSLSLSIAEGPGFSRSIDLGSTEINIAGVNDLATLSVPSSISLIEDGSQAVSGIVISDIDGDHFHVELRAQQGTLNISGLNASLLSGGSNGSDFIRLSGNLSDVQQALANLSYGGPANLNGNQADQITVQLSEDNSGTIANVINQSIDVDISAVNDAPTISAPTSATVISGDTLSFSGLSISDADAGSSQITVRVGIAQGSLQLGQSTGLSVNPVSFSDSSGNTVSGLELIGSVSDINSALAGLSLNTVAGLSNSVTETFTIIVNDMGNSGGAAQQASAEVLVTINPAGVSTDPSNSGTLPSSLAVVEDTFSPLDLSSVVLVDADGSASTYQLTLSTNNGQLQVSGTAGLLVNNVGTGTVQLSGSLSDLNDWLSSASGLQYQHDTEHRFGDAADSLSLSIAEGPGFSRSIDLGSTDINIAGVNDLATLSVPSSISLIENSERDIPISLVDVDGENYSAQLTSQHGDLYIKNLNPALIVSGENNSQEITISGSITEIQIALANLSYQSPSITDSDLRDRVTINITEINSQSPVNTLNEALDIQIIGNNEAPSITAPSAIEITSETQQIVGLTVKDGDAGVNNLELTLDVSGGKLTIKPIGSVEVQAISTDQYIVLVGNIADLNSSLQSLTYENDFESLDNEILRVVINDLGSSGGQAKSDIVDINLNLNPANVTPQSDNGLLVTDEDQSYSLSLSHFPFIDKYGDSLGVIEINADGISGDLYLNGEKILAKQLLEPQQIVDGNLVYRPADDQHGTAIDTLKFRLSDSYGAWSDVYNIQVNVEAVNDLPFNTGSSLSAAEAQALNWFNVSVAGITAEDIDAYGTDLQLRVTLSGPAHMQAQVGDGLTVIESSDTHMILSGSLEKINKFLDDEESISARVLDNQHQSIELTVEINDMGNTGKGVSTWVKLGSAEISIEPFVMPLDELGEEERENDNTPKGEDNFTLQDDDQKTSLNEPSLEAERLPREIADVNEEAAPEKFSFDVELDELQAVISPLPTADNLDMHRDRQQEQYEKLNNKLSLNNAMAKEVLGFSKAGYQFNTDDYSQRDNGSKASDEDSLSSSKIGKVLGASAGLGLLWWLTRAGSLLAAMISIRPLWNEIDPLPILSRNKSLSREDKDSSKEEENKND